MSWKTTRNLCLAVGMDGDYLAKPYTAAQLEQTLRRWLPAGPAEQPPKCVEPPSASDGAAPLAAIDSEVLAQYRELDPSGKLLHRLVRVYLDSSGELMGADRGGLLRRRCRRTAPIRPPLKSSSANVGALALSALLGQLESKGRQASLDDAALPSSGSAGNTGWSSAKSRHCLPTRRKPP